MLPGRLSALLVGMGDHDGRVDIDRDQAAVSSGRGRPGQGPGPLAGRRPGRADRAQRPRGVRGQRGDQAGYHRVRGHGAEQGRVGPQHGGVGQAVAAQRQRHRQVRDHLPRAVHRPRRPPPAQPGRQLLLQSRHDGGAGQQDAAGMRDQALPVSGDQHAGTAGGILHVRSAFALVRTGP
jgi:hypothetical protein